jgi:DNA (cytosine-5)-methyltransferase 1
MRDHVAQLEQALLPEAGKICPVGSDPQAVVHQWLNAIAYGHQLFGEDSGPFSERLISDLWRAECLPSRRDLRRKLLESVPLPPAPNPAFTFIDLFAGIGGFRLALQGLGGVSVFSSEWDKSAQQTYRANFGETPFGDITALTNESVSDADIASALPMHDVLAAGFPCQPFSHAGVSARTSVGKDHGFKCTTQGTLFFDVMRIASVKRPKVLFLENVRNIERHDNGYTFKVIADSVEEIDYDFRFSIVDSSSLVPQRRVRCYMVCFRRDLKVDFSFPSFEGEVKPLNTILEKKVDEAFTISDRLWEGHKNRTKRNLARGTGFTAFTADLDKPAHTLVARYGKDGKECLIPQKGKNPRLLTPRECARLQGFPEEFEIPVAKTQAYRQFGNSVPVPVVSEIAQRIIRNLI